MNLPPSFIASAILQYMGVAVVDLLSEMMEVYMVCDITNLILRLKLMKRDSIVLVDVSVHSFVNNSSTIAVAMNG